MDKNKDRLTLKTSTENDAVLKSLQPEQQKMEFRTDYDEFRKRIRTYNGNVTKSYALMWEICTKGMQNKIKTRTDFEIII